MRIDLLEQALNATTAQCEATRAWLLDNARGIAEAQNLLNDIAAACLPLGEIEIWTTTGPSPRVGISGTIHSRHRDRLVDFLSERGLLPASTLREGRALYHQHFARAGAAWELHVHFDGKPLGAMPGTFAHCAALES